MAGEHPEGVDRHMLPASELARIDERAAKHAAARRVYYEGSFKGAAIAGVVGITGHLLGMKYHAPYRKLYIGIKSLLVTSTFALGWWIGGEKAFQVWHRQEFDSLANRKRRALEYMKEHRAKQPGGGSVQLASVPAIRGSPQMSPTPQRGGTSTRVMPNVEAASPLP